MKYLTLINIFATIIMALIVNIYNKRKNKNNCIQTNFFQKPPLVFELKFALHQFNKFRVEALLFLVANFLVMIFFLIFSYVINSIQSNIDELDFYLIFAFGEFVLLIGGTLIFSKMFESFNKLNRYNKFTDFDCYLTNDAIYFPFYTLEGKWREIMDGDDANFLKLCYSDITDFKVEPSRGIRRVSPPYYVINIKNQELKINITRSQYYGIELKMIEFLQKNLQCKVLINDELK